MHEPTEPTSDLTVCHYPFCYRSCVETAAYCSTHELLWIAHKGSQSVGQPFTRQSPYYRWEPRYDEG